MFAKTAAPPSSAPIATPAVGTAAALVPWAVGRRLLAACEMELALLPAALVRELMAEVTPPAPAPVADVSWELMPEASDETWELRLDRAELIAELADEPAPVALLATELAAPVPPVAPPVGAVTVGVASWAYRGRRLA